MFLKNLKESNGMLDKFPDLDRRSNPAPLPIGFGVLAVPNASLFSPLFVRDRPPVCSVSGQFSSFVIFKSNFLSTRN